MDEKTRESGDEQNIPIEISHPSLSGDMQAFASTFSTVVMGGIGLAMALMGIVAVGALLHRTAMGGAQEYAVFNLGASVWKFHSKWEKMRWNSGIKTIPGLVV